jgi:RNA polymerase sigma factor (sigma-70 family)
MCKPGETPGLLFCAHPVSSRPHINRRSLRFFSHHLFPLSRYNTRFVLTDLRRFLSDISFGIYFIPEKRQPISLLIRNKYQVMNSQRLTQLLEGCLQQDRVCQKEIYHIFYNYVLSIAQRYVGSGEEAREVLNDTFFRVFSKIKNYNPEHPFKTWLSRLAMCTAIDHYRKYQQKRLPETAEPDTLVYAVDASVLDHLAADDLLFLIQKLSPAYRMAINLYAVEGYDHAEIAPDAGYCGRHLKIQFV